MSESRMFRVLIALVCAIAWSGTTAAESSLPPCSSVNGIWNRCVGARAYLDGAKYVGEFQDGKRAGQGTMTWPNGLKYVGGWKDGKRDGRGTATTRNGEKYVGEFRNDHLTGQGTFTYKDGRKYVGEFQDGNALARAR